MVAFGIFLFSALISQVKSDEYFFFKKNKRFDLTSTLKDCIFEQ